MREVLRARDERIREQYCRHNDHSERNDYECGGSKASSTTNCFGHGFVGSGGPDRDDQPSGDDPNEGSDNLKTPENDETKHSEANCDFSCARHGLFAITDVSFVGHRVSVSRRVGLKGNVLHEFVALKTMVGEYSIDHRNPARSQCARRALHEISNTLTWFGAGNA